MDVNTCRLCAKVIGTEKLRISEEIFDILTSLKIFEGPKDDFLSNYLCFACNDKMCEIKSWIKSCQQLQKTFSTLNENALMKHKPEMEIETLFEYVDENVQLDDPEMSESEEQHENDEEYDVLEDCAVEQVSKRSKYTSANKKQYTCTDCAEVFSGKTNYRNHRKNCKVRGTSDSRRNLTYICEYENCGKILSSLVGFNAHTAMHKRQEQAPIKSKELPVLLCSICGKTFKQSTALQVHILTHQNLKPFECLICHKRYYTHYALKTHMDTHGDERKFKCETCSKDFFTLRALQKHKIIHNADARKIKCLLCPLKFVRPYQLTMHMMVHSGEKPHSCLHCDKAFRFSWDLRKHVNKIHTNEGTNDPLVIEIQEQDEDDFNEMEIFE